MKKLSCLFSILAIILSNFMCFMVAYNYRDMLCGVEHKGYSASVWTSFLIAIPFLLAIVICVVLAIVFYKKCKKK